MTKNIVIIAKKPIQHFTPFYKYITEQRDFNLNLIYLSKEGVDEYFDKDLNQNVRWNMNLLDGYKYSFLTSKFQLLRALNTSQPDKIIFYGYSGIEFYLTAFYSKLKNVELAMVSDSEMARNYSSIKLFFKKIVISLKLKLFSSFLTVGDRNEEYLEYFGAKKNQLFRSPFTIDENKYLSLNKDKSSEYSKEFSDDKFDLLIVGKFIERKNFLFTLKALLKSNVDNVNLIFAGNGPLFDECEKFAEKNQLNATFLGFVNVDELPTLYLKCDALLHPALADAHPLVSSEACILEKPMFFSNRVGSVGSSDVVQPNKNAMVFDPEVVEELSDIFIELARGNIDLKSMSKNSKLIWSTQNMDSSYKGFSKWVKN